MQKPKTQFRNINAFKDLTTYRLPPAGWVSILHRISGGLLFICLPLLIWLFDKSVSSEYSFAELTAVFNTGLGIIPAWSIKLVIVLLIWASLHHLVAGIRHFYMDISHSAVSLKFGRVSAQTVLVLSLVLTLLLGLKLFGIY
jgi:succinate dehydrogenase / fumarate reductase cytochrome b subunit